MVAGTDTLRRSSGYHALVGVGLASFGLVHLIVAWIALRVAFSEGGDASQQGALRQIARQPVGLVLLWAMAVGLLVLAAWQVLEAAVRRDGQHSARQVRRRISAVGRALVYLVVGVTAARVALGARTSSSGQSEETLSARLLNVPFGRALVAAVGVAVLAVGVSQIVKGVRRTFTDDLAGATDRRALLLGTVGYCAKGVALILIALLFGWAAWSYDPQKAGGMDQALSTLRTQPSGPVLLCVLAGGLAAFGLYCFYWSRNAKY